MNQTDIDLLRIAADKAKMEGRFDIGERLHEMLDALEAVRGKDDEIAALEDRIEALKDTLRDVLNVVQPRPETLEEMNAALDEIESTVNGVL